MLVQQTRVQEIAPLFLKMAGIPWLRPQTHVPAGKLLMCSWTSHMQSCTRTYAADIARSLVVIDGFLQIAAPTAASRL